jgi:tetratricopeptide (TPR) repeat protein
MMEETPVDFAPMPFARTARLLSIASVVSWAGAPALDARAQESPILVGRVGRADLETPPYSDWFDSQYSRYQPAAPVLESLRPRLAGVSVEAYFGTWCGDSRRQIPRLLRVLDLEAFDKQRLSLIALSDRPMQFKQAPGNPQATRRVHRTPTIVVLRDGVEAGRIVETPAVSLEADLLGILEGRGPEPKYGAEAWVHDLFTDLKPEEAIEALKAGGPEVLKRGDPGSLWHYAENDLLKNGRVAEAKAVLDLHLELNPQSVIGQILMSEALTALGRTAEALKAIERALVLEPDNDRAKRAAAKLRGS